ncbi:MAG: response regulator [Cyclobacteriaceae bacterium]
MKSLFQKFISLGHHPDDSEEEKLRKSSLLIMSGPFALAAVFIWGPIYFANGLIIPGAIPFSYGILSMVNIVSFSFSKKYKFFRSSQLFLILILPFALQISLGGFVPSSAVMYWAIVAPAGAMFFDSVRRSAYWFGAYMLMVFCAYLINDLLPGYVNWNLSDRFINALFLMNVVGVSSLVFAILYYFVGKITDLNADIEMKNIALKEQSDKLAEMDKIKSRFFANISHEFRTPLTLILGMANKQITKQAASQDEQKDGLMIKGNAQRLLQLINQLLDLSKLESNELKLASTKSDIIVFTKNLFQQFESLASTKNIKTTFNGHGLNDRHSYQPIELFFDHEQFQKILTNLFSNAVKFTNGGGTIAVEVNHEKDTAKEKNVVTIKISNTGDGIQEDKLQFVFDRFYQVDSDSNRKYEGTGIGLALVKELVELHGGSVTVQSNLGVTSFEVQLPMNEDYLKEDEKVELKNPDFVIQVPTTAENIVSPFAIVNPEEVPDTDKEGQLDVLIVEDNQDLRSFIKSILQHDYYVIEAVDGIDGFEKAESLIPDLIVSDVMMPRMDGYNLCKQLKSDEKTNHIPIILLTAKAGRESRLEGLELGADDYLVKPFDEEELRIRIKNLISIREKLQKKYRQESGLKPKEVKVTSVHQKFLKDLKEVVEDNIENELFSVDDLGKAMAMSRSQIHRKLKALTNQSATTFIRNYRLHRAADLLSQQAGSVTEIAYQVGFNSQTYFSSSFQELFGCSPSEFKHRLK